MADAMTFRVTDERDLRMAETLGRYTGGRTGRPTPTVLKMARDDAARFRRDLGNPKGPVSVYLWVEKPRTHEGIEVVFVKEIVDG